MLLFQGIRDGLKNILLSPEESHHCFKVTRHRAGDTVLVTDFGGIIWSGKIVGIANDQGNIEIIEIYKELVPKGGKITLGVSLTNHLDRFEWFLEKLWKLVSIKFTQWLVPALRFIRRKGRDGKKLFSLRPNKH